MTVIKQGDFSCRLSHSNADHVLPAAGEADVEVECQSRWRTSYIADLQQTLTSLNSFCTPSHLHFSHLVTACCEVLALACWSIADG